MLHRRLARPFALVLLAAPALVACGGRAISLGTSDKMTSVSSKQLTAVTTGSAGTCPSGWVHPNICCSGDSQASCGEWASNPLRACDSGDTTYPDPLLVLLALRSRPEPLHQRALHRRRHRRQSAAVVRLRLCVPTGLVEPRGANTAGSTDTPACCTIEGTTTVCEAQATATTVNVLPPSVCIPPVTGVVDASVTDGGPAPTSDGGVIALDAGAPQDASFDDGGYPSEDGGAPYDDGGPVVYDDGGPIDEDAYPYDDGGSLLCDGSSEDAGYPGYDGGAASLCAPCPAGWTASSVQPEVCCTTTPSGVPECFSQATGSAYGIGSPSVDAGVEDAAPSGVNVADDAGPSTGVSTGVSSNWSGTGSAGETCSGSSDVCSCEQTTGGHTYAIDCYTASSGPLSCSCSVDGTASGTTSVASCGTPSNVMTAFSATSGCGF